jgi:hypothetical protein
MDHFHRTTRLAGFGLLAGMFLVSWPAGARAASIGFQNHLKVSIYVEAATIIRGQVVRSKPLLIQSGKSAWHKNVPPGNRVIYVYLVNRPGQLLFRGAVGVGTTNLFFAVQPNVGPRGVMGVKIVPAKPPK